MNHSHKRALWLSGLTAIGASVLANILALLAFRPFVIDPINPLHALSVGPVVTLTVAGALAAIVVYAILRHLLEKPNKTFITISVLFFLISLVPDYMILNTTNVAFAGANTQSVALLMLMHAIAGLIIVFTLVRLTRELHEHEDPHTPPPLF